MAEAMNEGREIREQDAAADEVQDELMVSEEEKAEIVEEAASEPVSEKVAISEKESKEEAEEK
jgi:hypothetical protein